MNGELPYDKLMAIRNDLSKLAVPLGTVPTCSEECKRCGEEITYKHDDPLVYCPGCNTKYFIGVDAEFVNGSWRDLTKLTRA